MKEILALLLSFILAASCEQLMTFSPLMVIDGEIKHGVLSKLDSDTGSMTNHRLIIPTVDVKMKFTSDNIYDSVRNILHQGVAIKNELWIYAFDLTTMTLLARTDISDVVHSRDPEDEIPRWIFFSMDVNEATGEVYIASQMFDEGVDLPFFKLVPPFQLAIDEAQHVYSSQMSYKIVQFKSPFAISKKMSLTGTATVDFKKQRWYLVTINPAKYEQGIWPFAIHVLDMKSMKVLKEIEIPKWHLYFGFKFNDASGNIIMITAEMDPRISYQSLNILMEDIKKMKVTKSFASAPALAELSQFNSKLTKIVEFESYSIQAFGTKMTESGKYCTFVHGKNCNSGNDVCNIICVDVHKKQIHSIAKLDVEGQDPDTTIFSKMLL